MGKAEIVDFASERAARRPDELPHDIQETLSLCADDVGTGEIASVSRLENEDYGTFYLRDLGRRMLASFMKLGRVAKAISIEYDRLPPEKQIEVEDTIKSIKESEGGQ